MVRRTTWVLLIIFSLLLGFAWLFQRYQTNKADNIATLAPTDELTNIYNLVEKQVNEVSIMDSRGDKIVFTRNSGSEQWSIADIPSEQADSFQIESTLAQLFSIKAQETLTQTPPLDAIGLNIPGYSIIIKTVEGESIITYVGSLTPIENGYYIRVNSGPVVISDKVVLGDVINMLANPPIAATPTPIITIPETILPTDSTTRKTPTP
jgi:hypothetical protein